MISDDNVYTLNVYLLYMLRDLCLYRIWKSKPKGYVPCACNDYQEYIDENWGHVVTGNLNIIGNEEIRKLLIKGLNFWEKQPLDVGKAYGSIQSGIDMFINLG